MPNRYIKESIWTSPNLNQLSIQAERHFFRLLPLPDDHGCCELTPLVVKGRCYPLQSKVSEKDIQKWNEELEQFDIIRSWIDRGRIFALFPTWSEHQRVRSLHQRRTPEPPAGVVNRQQVSSSDRRIPIPIPILNPIPKKHTRKSAREGFESFWEEYPKKKSKADAEKVWDRLEPNEQLQAEILQGLKRAMTSENWRKDGGQFIPYPAKWLRHRGWEDEIEGNRPTAPPRPKILDEPEPDHETREENAIKAKELIKNLTQKMAGA